MAAIDLTDDEMDRWLEEWAEYDVGALPVPFTAPGRTELSRRGVPVGLDRVGQLVAQLAGGD